MKSKLEFCGSFVSLVANIGNMVAYSLDGVGDIPVDMNKYKFVNR